MIDRLLTSDITAIGNALTSAGHDALLVGGCVRDALMGADSADIDIVTDAAPAVLRALLEPLAAVRSVYDLGLRFGTVGVALADGRTLEATAYRPDALPLSGTAARFAADAAHRDFTVNAMALDLASRTLLDPLGGRADLEAGLLRAPGSATERFDEDPLRAIRAARFVSELGFEIEPSTRDAMPGAAAALDAVAVERLRDELTKLLVGPHAEAALHVLLDCGALAVVLPEVAALSGVGQPSFHDLDVFSHTAQAVGLAPANPVLRWATLLHDAGKAPTRTVEADGRIRFFRHAQQGASLAEQTCRRLRFSNDETAAITHLVAEHMRLGDLGAGEDRAVDRAVRKLDLWAGAGDGARLLASAEDALELTMADFAATAHRDEAPAVRATLADAIAASRERGSHRPVKSPVTGRDLMAEFGLGEGPAIGEALDAVVEAVESGELAADDRAGALAIAKGVLGR